MNGIDIQVIPPLKRRAIYKHFENPGNDWKSHIILADEKQRADLIFYRHYDFFELTGLWIIFEAAGTVNNFPVGKEIFLPPLSWVRLQIIENLD